MSRIFGPVYAGAYDAIYGDKDYEAECRLLRDLFARYSAEPVKTVLDLGCGSGNHLLPLAAAGLHGLGVDCSFPMLTHARGKAAAAGLDSLCFVCADIRQFEVNRRFDAALMMFAVLGYQIRDADVLAALRTARSGLRPGGVLIFDCWYGPAVLASGPSDRVKSIQSGEGLITRFSSGALDAASHTCRVDFRLTLSERGTSKPDDRESHVVRFFFPDEMDRFLTLSGFSMARLGRFPDLDLDPDSEAWNVLCVAVAQ